MPLVPLDPRTAFVILGIVYLMMSGLVWTVLHRHHGRMVTGLWCGGSVVIGLSYLLYSLRGSAPESLSVLLPNAFSVTGLALCVQVLRMERFPASSWRQMLAITLTGLAVSLASSTLGEAFRRPTSFVLFTVYTAWVAREAQLLGRACGSRAAVLISGSFAFFAITLAVRLATTLLGLTKPPAFTPAWDLIAVLLAGLVAALFGNVGYIGLALEALQSRRELQARDLALEQAQRAAAEAQTTALEGRLTEREEFVRVLAHEVRQPLNNASAALQGARAALQSEARQHQGDEAGQRLQRAQNVIAHIVGSIDNTLAATTQLASRQPLAPRDADVNMLIELSLGDLGPAQRRRVRLDESVHARTAAMDIGLMRLALRNLLANALAYSPLDTPVTLKVSDSDEPLGLVFEVRDQGHGLSAAMQQRLFERGARGNHGLPGHGLGLYVVRQIMRRHGGQASWSPNDGGGSVFRLWLPLME